MQKESSDISSTIEGLLDGLDSLLARRDEIVGKPSDSSSAPAVVSGGGGVPVRSAFAAARSLIFDFSETNADLARCACDYVRALSVNEGLMSKAEVLLDLLGRRAMRLKMPGNTPTDLLVSPLWGKIFSALPADAELCLDSDPVFFQVRSRSLNDLLGQALGDDALSKVRGALGKPTGVFQTISITRDERSSQWILRLPVFPEIGRCLVAQIGGRSAGRWSLHGVPAVFFWFENPQEGARDIVGQALIPPGSPTPLLDLWYFEGRESSQKNKVAK
jgi:hypothetical protein